MPNSNLTHAWLLREARIRASRLLKAARAGDPAALARLDPHLKRRRALDVAAQELAGVPYTILRENAVLAGIACPERLFSPKVSMFWNHWFARYSDAAHHRSVHGGLLFHYKSQFVVVELDFLEALGLDPADADWQHIGFDWVTPQDAAAFVRLNARLCAAGFGAQEVSHAN